MSPKVTDQKDPSGTSNIFTDTETQINVSVMFIIVFSLGNGPMKH